MASICNNEQAFFGVMSGHDRKILSLSAKPQGPVARSKLPGRVFSRLVSGFAHFSQAWP